MVGDMIRRSKSISEDFSVQKRSIFSVVLNASFKIIASKESTAHGLEGISLVVYDELAQSPSNALHSTLEEALTGQPNGLCVALSTTAPKVTNPMQTILRGLKAQERAGYPDRNYLVKLYQGDPDPEADLFSDEQQIRSNPSLRHIPGLKETLDSLRDRARTSSFYRSRYRTFRLNIPGDTTTMLVDPVQWAQARHPDGTGILKELEGERCRLGIDLSRSKDLTCVAMAFPPNPEKGRNETILHHEIFCLAEMIPFYVETTGAPFDEWARDSYINSVDGQVINYRYVAERMMEMHDRYRIQGGRYDTWQFAQLEAHLDELGFPHDLEPCRQGYKTMNVLIINMENLLDEGLLLHTGNPCADFCWQSADVKTAPGSLSDERMVERPDDTCKVDPAVAGLMAIGDGIDDLGLVGTAPQEVEDDEEVKEFLSEFNDEDIEEAFGGAI